MTNRRSATQHYPIRAVARMTGLSVDTLRAWERRYAAVVPRRNRRGRLYSDMNVARLKQLAELVARGHAIGTIASLSDAELGALRAGADAQTTRQSEPVAVARLEVLASAMDRYDLEAFETVLNRHAAVLPARELIFSVILPILREVGRRWTAGKLRPSQEHFVSAIVRNVLGSLLRTTARYDASPKIVFATPSGERHELGLLCSALLASSAGYGVVYLGPDVPAADIAHAAATTGAQVVMLSVTTPGVVTRSEAKQLAALPPGIELWVGGPEARALLDASGERARQVENLDDVVPMVARHAR
jgi:DNA-binding transcriptional MerR regulator/methylmalonyl-CoA mutase cobalamin-binding subunit